MLYRIVTSKYIIRDSQLLNQQHNTDSHFPRANELKCVIYRPLATPNGNAACLFEEPDLATSANWTRQACFVYPTNQKSFMCNSI